MDTFLPQDGVSGVEYTVESSDGDREKHGYPIEKWEDVEALLQDYKSRPDGTSPTFSLVALKIHLCDSNGDSGNKFRTELDEKRFPRLQTLHLHGTYLHASRSMGSVVVPETLVLEDCPILEDGDRMRLPEFVALLRRKRTECQEKRIHLVNFLGIVRGIPETEEDGDEINWTSLKPKLELELDDSTVEITDSFVRVRWFLHHVTFSSQTRVVIKVNNVPDSFKLPSEEGDLGTQYKLIPVEHPYFYNIQFTEFGMTLSANGSIALTARGHQLGQIVVDASSVPQNSWEVQVVGAGRASLQELSQMFMDYRERRVIPYVEEPVHARGPDSVRISKLTLEIDLLDTSQLGDLKELLVCILKERARACSGSGPVLKIIELGANLGDQERTSVEYCRVCSCSLVVAVLLEEQLSTERLELELYKGGPCCRSAINQYHDAHNSHWKAGTPHSGSYLSHST